MSMIVVGKELVSDPGMCLDVHGSAPQEGSSSGGGRGLTTSHVRGMLGPLTGQ